MYIKTLLYVLISFFSLAFQASFAEENVEEKIKNMPIEVTKDERIRAVANVPFMPLDQQAKIQEAISIRGEYVEPEIEDEIIEDAIPVGNIVLKLSSIMKNNDKWTMKVNNKTYSSDNKFITPEIEIVEVGTTFAVFSYLPTYELERELGTGVRKSRGRLIFKLNVGSCFHEQSLSVLERCRVIPESESNT